MKIKSICRIFLMLSLSIFLTHVGLIQSAEADPAITITPDKGPPGTKLSIVGTGFIPEENVKLIFHAGILQLQLAAADTGGINKVGSDGTFKLQPPGGIPVAKTFIKPGIYKVEAIGDKGSIASTTLEVKAK